MKIGDFRYKVIGFLINLAELTMILYVVYAVRYESILIKSGVKLDSSINKNQCVKNSYSN